VSSGVHTRHTTHKNGSKWSAPTDGIASGSVCLLAAVHKLENLNLVSAFARQANTLSRDSAFTVDEKRRWQRFDAVVHPCDGAVTKDDTVVHRLLPKERLDRPPTVVIHRHAKHGEAPVLVRILELDEPWNFGFARSAPRRPKIEQHYLSFEIGKTQGAPFGSLRLKSGAALRSPATLSSEHARLGAEEQPTSSEVTSAMAANGPLMADEDTLKTPPWDYSLGGAPELQAVDGPRPMHCEMGVATGQAALEFKRWADNSRPTKDS
jgi:hypothetical protein